MLAQFSLQPSGDRSIWIGRPDMAGSDRVSTSKGTSTIADRLRRGELGYTSGVLNAQSAKFATEMKRRERTRAFAHAPKDV